jgi:hypothetical protein
MYMWFRRASDEELRRLCLEPRQIRGFLEAFERPPERPWVRGDCGLDKAWHGIHFMLTGTVWAGDPPLNFLIRGGTAIGDIDVGYGPARALWSEKVRAIAAAVAGISPDDLREAFDRRQMEELEIYAMSSNATDEEELGYFLRYFAGLQDFFSRAAADGTGLVKWVD